MKAKIIELEGKQGAVQEESAAANGNVDILKRLTRLENAVFASKNKLLLLRQSLAVRSEESPCSHIL